MGSARDRRLVSTGPEHLLAVYSFAFQIYFDFSGYTDIARGIALWLGFELPLNFREPYLSRNPAEFWRRWHITLSQWLRDYLYIPLGGNRSGAARTYLNLMLTMGIGGLGHGAGWNFVIWGGLHGVFLVAHRLAVRGGEGAAPFSWPRDLPKAIVLFHGVCLAWIFFRAPNVGDAWKIIERIATGPYPSYGWPIFQCAVIAICAALHPLERFVREHRPQLQSALDGFGWRIGEGVMMGIVLALVLLLGGAGGEFIYSQF